MLRVCSLKNDTRIRTERSRAEMRQLRSQDPNVTDDRVTIQKTCRHLKRDLCVFICSSGGLGRSSAWPVYAPPGGPLQHLQAQTGRAPQRRLQPGLACHEQVELNSGALHLSGGTSREHSVSFLFHYLAVKCNRFKLYSKYTFLMIWYRAQTITRLIWFDILHFLSKHAKT